MKLSHLSPGIWVWIPDISKPVNDFLQSFLKLRYDPPACWKKTVTVAGRVYSASTTGNGVYACVELKDNKVRATVHSNSPFVWRVSPKNGDATGAQASAPLDSAQVVTLAAYDSLQSYRFAAETVLVPGGVAPIEFASGQAGATITAQVDAGLGLLAVLVAGLNQVFIVLKVDVPLAKLAERGACLSATVTAAGSAPDAAGSANLATATLACLSAAVDGAAAMVIALITTLPSLLVTQVVGIAGEVTKTNTVKISINSQPTSTGEPFVADCSNVQTTADRFGLFGKNRFPGYAHWADAPNFAAVIEPLIKSMVVKCGKQFVEDVMSEANIVGKTWMAISSIINTTASQITSEHAAEKKYA